MKTVNIRSAIYLTTGVFFSCYSYSFAATPLPSTVQPGRAEQDLAPKPQLPVTPSTPITAPEAAMQQAPAGAEKIRFVLREVSVEGNTRYPPEILSVYWGELLGKEITLADVYSLARKLTVRYRSDGHILSQVVIPAQDIADGKVRLQAIEGFIDRVEIKDGKGSPLNNLLPYLDRIRSEKPLTSGTLERYLLLINDVSGHYARAYLQASKTPGAADLVVVVEKNPLDGSLSIHNRISELLGHAQFDVSVGFNDLLGQRERNSLRLVTTSSRRMDLVSYNGELPIGYDGLKLMVGLNPILST